MSLLIGASVHANQPTYIPQLCDVQEAVLRMNEAKSALEGVQKSVTEAEAAQAAAEALRPWPSDARLVPPDYPLYPPSTPQRLHPDVATLGSYFFGLSSPSATEGPSSPHPGAQMRQELDQATGVDIIMPEATDGAGRHAEIEDEAQHDMSQQGTLDNVAEPEGSHRPDEGMTEEQGVESNAGEVLQAKDDTGVEKSADMQTNVTGWQRRVQSGWDEKQLQQVVFHECCGRLWLNRIPDLPRRCTRVQGFASSPGS